MNLLISILKDPIFLNGVATLLLAIVILVQHRRLRKLERLPSNQDFLKKKKLKK